MSQGLDNRWIVAVNSRPAAECLVREGFYLYNRHIVIRFYDDVLMEEYEEYQEYLDRRADGRIRRISGIPGPTC